MRLAPHTVWSTIATSLGSTAGIASDIASVIAVCEETFPHADWALCASLPFAQGAQDAGDHLLASWGADPAPFELHSLWFGVCNPVNRNGDTTADLYIAGGSRYDAGDQQYRWLEHLDHRPADPYAESEVLAAVYSVAYGNESGLGNDAEWALGLAFSVFAVRDLLRRPARELRVLSPSPIVGIGVGFDGGDFFHVGELRPDGLALNPTAGAT